MKKHILFLLFLALSTISQAQPWSDSIGITITTNPPATGWLYPYNYKPGGTRVGDISTSTDTIFRSSIWAFPEPQQYRKFSIFFEPSSLTPEDSLKVAILSNQITALMERDTDEFILLSVLCSHIAEADFYESRFRDVFPATLDLHINRNTPFAAAAGRLKRRYFPERK